MDVYRDILLGIGNPDSEVRNKYPFETLTTYTAQMRGLIDGDFRKNMSGQVRCMARLTEEGQRFADAIRDDGQWRDVKHRIGTVGLPMGLEAARRIAGDR